jgi:predicted HAD superfamily Cof-like phosphohydrolase
MFTKVRLKPKKKQHMTNPFRDQEKFMKACDQTVAEYNEEQYTLYCNLIREEFQELLDSTTAKDDLDALIDILVVTVGAIHSLGADAEGAWKEVMRTNFAKIDKDTGKVRKREDGKVLKPQGWTPPELEQYLSKTHFMKKFS